MTLEETRTHRLAFAGASALTVLTWYALPDAVRSRRTRAIIKAGLLGVTAAGAAQVPVVYPDAAPATPRIDVPAPVVATLGVAALAAATAGTVWFEKAVFEHGERRRAEGVRCAHTPAAVVLALATGAAALVDWPALADRVVAQGRTDLGAEIRG